MNDCDDHRIRFRNVMWLNTGDGVPVKVLSRTLSSSSVFVEYTGRLNRDSVEMIFPELDSDAGPNRIQGRVIGRCRDGIWVCFNRHAETQPHQGQFAGEP
jgi:hypothetical protein